MTKENVSYTSSSMAAENKWHACNGQQFRKLVHAGLVALEENHRKVNDMNVFPVPDGDTGTNMLLTMRAAYKRIQDGREEHVGKVAQDLSHGALMGARGNSGVILSQIWRGLANGLEDKASFDASDLADALSEASDTAYKGVMRPVEGTILTVIREGAEEARDALGGCQENISNNESVSLWPIFSSEKTFHRDEDGTTHRTDTGSACLIAHWDKSVKLDKMGTMLQRNEFVSVWPLFDSHETQE